MAELICPPWLSFTLMNLFRRLAHDPDRILAPFVKEGDTALDIGCGPGFFAVPMARMVGEHGLVVAVDIQPKMLEKTRRRAERAGVAARIRLHLAARNSLGLDLRADFALAFWMVHEVSDPARLFRDILAALKPSARLLVVEPRLHVPERGFARIVAAAESAGFVRLRGEDVRLVRAAVFRPYGKDPIEPASE